jgi:proline iminopeptidase
MVCKFSANFPACAPSAPTAGLRVLRQGVLRRGWHRIPWWLVGTPGTPLWAVPHGGPGSGASAVAMAPFDLSRCQVLLWDQRGCGGARPSGGRSQTGWRHLVADMEVLRQTIGAERWSVLGGSWGATLALAYARAYPDRVERLVLRGAFLWTHADMAHVFAPQCRGTPRHHALLRAWPVARAATQVLHRVQRVFHFGEGVTHPRTLSAWQWLERHAVLEGLRRARRHTSGSQGSALRQRLERQQRRTEAQWQGRLPIQPAPLTWAKARVQMAVLGARRGWSQRTVTQALLALAQHRVPVDWLHGQWDAVCQPTPAQAAHRRLPSGLSRWRSVPSGHLSVEPAMALALRQTVQGAAP